MDDVEKLQQMNDVERMREIMDLISNNMRKQNDKDRMEMLAMLASTTAMETNLMSVQFAQRLKTASNKTISTKQKGKALMKGVTRANPSLKLASHLCHIPGTLLTFQIELQGLTRTTRAIMTYCFQIMLIKIIFFYYFIIITKIIPDDISTNPFIVVAISCEGEFI